ncbi:MAG: hypothetical protein KDK34_14645 [Leptospiraceae bacterium]|nr:hypothetical protein [Leptospiraceae bacterium]
MDARVVAATTTMSYDPPLKSYVDAPPERPRHVRSVRACLELLARSIDNQPINQN